MDRHGPGAFSGYELCGIVRLFSGNAVVGVRHHGESSANHVCLRGGGAYHHRARCGYGVRISHTHCPAEVRCIIGFAPGHSKIITGLSEESNRRRSDLEERKESFEPIHVYTDMALEARDIVRGDAKEEVPGVRVRETRRSGVVVTEVEIYEESAERLMGKPRGHYITLDVPTFKDRDPDLKGALISQLTDQLKALFPQDTAKSALIVGLGNWNATPDALGPRVVERLLVTRHLGRVVPEDMRHRMRAVSAVAPGVLGTTGIETLDIIRGIVSEAKPDFVVAIDALAARNLDRLLGSVQIADTGIHPGSGVGNRRQGLTEESVGVPVIAIGVCTVVQSISIAQEAIHLLSQQLAGDMVFYDILQEMAPSEQRGLIDEVLGTRFAELMVTPKEIDTLIDDMADALAESLNRALQPQLDKSEWL